MILEFMHGKSFPFYDETNHKMEKEVTKFYFLYLFHCLIFFLKCLNLTSAVLVLFIYNRTTFIAH